MCVGVHQWMPVIFITSLPILTRLTTLPYSDKDQVGDYTMLAGDIVHFHIATDRRDGSRRATYVRLHRLIEDQKEKTGREKVRR